MLNLAFVGTGWWGNELAKAAAALPDKIGIAGCFSLSADECDRFRSAHGGAVFDRFEQILGDPDVGAVVLATPHTLHWQQIIAVANAGKNVFCEKPMTLDVQTGAQAITACADNQVVLAVGHNRRFSDCVAKMKQLIDDGSCGKILHVEGHYCGDSAMHFDADYWRADRAEVPGGSLTPMALHIVDTMCFLLGPVSRLTALCKRQAVSVDIDDTTSVMFELDSGITGTLGTLFAAPQISYLRIYGTKANLEARTNYSELTVFPGGDATIEHFEFRRDDTLKSELQAFAAACAGEAPYPLPPQDALRNVAFVEAVKNSSAANGAWVTLAKV